MTIGSLFSGIGGLELGLEVCGLGPVVWQAENDPHARRVLDRWWPGLKRYNDVKEINATAARPDIICGGFPCQDVSVAGAGAGLDGARSGLWREFARIIRALKPGVVFIENVSALTSRGLDEVLRDLAEVGMDATWNCFRAADVGAPHRRERLFVLAYSDRERVRQLAERDQRRGRGVREAERGDAEPLHAGEALADADGGRRERGREREQESGGLEGSRGRLADRRGYDWGQHRFPPGPAEIHRWTDAQPAVRRSAARVPFGMDRRWRTKNWPSDRLRLLGNAVVPQCAALAFRTLAARVIAGTTEVAA